MKTAWILIVSLSLFVFSSDACWDCLIGKITALETLIKEAKNSAICRCGEDELQKKVTTYRDQELITEEQEIIFKRMSKDGTCVVTMGERVLRFLIFKAKAMSITHLRDFLKDYLNADPIVANTALVKLLGEIKDRAVIDQQEYLKFKTKSEGEFKAKPLVLAGRAIRIIRTDAAIQYMEGFMKNYRDADSKVANEVLEELLDTFKKGGVITEEEKKNLQPCKEVGAPMLYGQLVLEALIAKRIKEMGLDP